jgi:D-amino-acid dehydrogenase
VVSDLVLNRKPDISTAGLGIDRYDRHAAPAKILHSRPA